MVMAVAVAVVVVGGIGILKYAKDRRWMSKCIGDRFRRLL